MTTDLGLLLLRVGFGGMLFLGHGWSKLVGFSGMKAMFPDPLHIGHTASLALATFAEVFCALAVMIGVFTRLASIPIIITMLVAVSIVLYGASWQTKELPILFMLGFAAIALAGPGSWSVDWVSRKKK